MTSGRAIGLEAGCVRSLAIAAPRSGAGKTVLTLGIARALAERGVRIGCAKAGPDYIDPGFHQVACGRPSVNLDGWATPKEALLSMARRAAPPGGVLLIETAMGVLDGAAGPSPVVGGGDGSAAALASVLECPILLVLDVQKQAQSAALAVAGLRALRPDLNLAGVVLNRVASERHGRVVRRAIEALGAPVLGCAPRDDRLRAPERHLGLVQARERPNLETFIRQAASVVAESVDLDRLLKAAAPLPGVRSVAEEGALERAWAAPPLGARIAVADDAAFAFAYPHLLEAWRAQGAEIIPFAPLEDAAPDASADAVFLPGGYPELHAGRLAAAERFRAGMAAAIARGALVYGECGGYMALGEVLVDGDGAAHRMLGALPLSTSFAERRLTLGYRRLSARPGGPFDGALTAHEFHYATILAEGASDRLFDAWDAEGAPIGPIGLRRGRVAGSFAHVIHAI